MEVFFRIALYLIIGLILIGINIWFVRSVIYAFQGSDVVITPFQIIGQDDNNGQLGITLANMLQVQLRKIPQELQKSQDALVGPITKDQESQMVEGVAFLPTESLKRVNISAKLFASSDRWSLLRGRGIGDPMGERMRRDV